MQVSAPSDGARASLRYARLPGIAWRVAAALEQPLQWHLIGTVA